MTDFLLSLLSLLLGALALGIAWSAGRRLYLSWSLNTLLYGVVCGYAGVACGALAGVLTIGNTFDGAAALLAGGSLPLWLAVRALTTAPAHYGAAPADGPVFRSCRETLRDGQASST